MARLKIEKAFSQVPNELNNSSEISLKAKGLFSYLNGKSEDWEFASYRIAKEIKESEGCVKTTLQELEKHGWLERNRYQNEKGHWKVEYVLKAKSLGTKILPKEIPTEENPIVGNLDRKERKTLRKKENINKEITSVNNLDLENNETLLKEVEKVMLPKNHYLDLYNRASRAFKKQKSNIKRLNLGNETYDNFNEIYKTYTVGELKTALKGLMIQKNALNSIFTPHHLLKDNMFETYLNAGANNIKTLYSQSQDKDTKKGML